MNSRRRGWSADFLFGFGALFAIINPYGLAIIFLDKDNQPAAQD
ncbi:small neutral amino acid transporter SnatA (MarC family) [Bradyrhizobium sp. USDA 377]